MTKAAVLLALVAMLAGCGQPSREAEKPRPTPSPFVSGGWATVFGDAPKAIELLNSMGFRLSDYAPTPAGSHVAQAMATPMGDPSVKPVNTAHLTVNGDAQRIGRMVFSLDIVNLDASPFAKEQFARWVDRPLASLGLPGRDEMKRGIMTESPATGTLPGAGYQIIREKIDGGRRLVVTFTRPVPAERR
ncbi:hypothetical protein [Sphingomonas sp. Leaf25]|uniref:hypothetical protein n=1 Tax=Sphingomonas sp. Leaf25 TaxID=1735692 RepID=UPI0006F4990D|nr:hypothetical protein [Sphingomonas sp. Leaf25]KQM96616.1 hypothetical protein ASE78_11555 [Sphingomonas sp. Leaf25]